MFSWSTNNNRRGRRPGTGGVGDFPANRTSHTAQVIPGSIRAPPGELYTRQEHLDSYFLDKTLKKSTRKISMDDTTYDTVFQTTAGDALILRVYYPPPNSGGSSRAPQMTLVGVKATHDWLSHNMKVIGYSAIQSDNAWKQSRMKLGSAVREVVTHLQLHPPNVMEMTDPGLAKIQSNIGGGNNNTIPKSNNNKDAGPPDYDTLVNNISPPSPVDMPRIPTQFTKELNSKSREELQEMLDDELEFLTLVNQIPVYREINLQRESLLEENAKLATSLLERQEEYTMLHGEVSDLKASLGTKLQEFAEWQQKQDEIVKPPNIDHVTKELNRAKKKAFMASEDFANDWVHGDGEEFDNVNQFCKAFIEKRQEMHTYAAKLERLKYQ